MLAPRSVGSLIPYIPLSPNEPVGVKISETRDYFLRDGSYFFYLADTCWSAFTNASLEEWEYYLEYRAAQGFNALQINVLHQHDRSRGPLEPTPPFAVRADGSWDFARVNEEYFDRVERMVEMAAGRGFVPALVLLWCNYVPGTWGSRLVKPQRVFPSLESAVAYVEYVAERFGKYEPIFVVSGDTNFESSESVEYYRAAFDAVKRRAPRSLTTMHLMGGLWQLPEEILRSPSYDFYMYQSSHGADTQHLAYELAERFTAIPFKRPIVNGEPCYEGMGWFNRYGRFTRADVRRAVWWSLLSGAKAGVAYGALGIWNWHKTGYTFPDERIWGASFDWRVALSFPGASDAAYAKWIFEKYRLYEMNPANELLIDSQPGVRVAKGRDGLAVYAPYAWRIKLAVDPSGYVWEGIDLEARRVIKPKVKAEGSVTVVEVAEAYNDVLILASMR